MAPPEAGELQAMHRKQPGKRRRFSTCWRPKVDTRPRHLPSSPLNVASEMGDKEEAAALANLSQAPSASRARTRASRPDPPQAQAEATPVLYSVYMRSGSIRRMTGDLLYRIRG
jgi:hypothetical protein